MGFLRIVNGLKKIGEGVMEGDLEKVAKGAVKTVVGGVEVITSTGNDSDSDDDDDDDD